MQTYVYVFICRWKVKKVKHQAIRMNSDGEIAQLADMFRLMGDPSRLRIILSCLHDPISVTEIAQQLDLSQSLVSHHLRLLRAARIVTSERRGKQIFYVAADEHIQCVIEDMVAHVGEPTQIEEGV